MLKYRDFIDLPKIRWDGLSKNPNAIHLLEANIDKIEWYWISGNPSIFEYDYKTMKEKCSIYKEELKQKAFHPTRIFKYVDEGYDVETINDFL